MSIFSRKVKATPDRWDVAVVIQNADKTMQVDLVNMPSYYYVYGFAKDIKKSLKEGEVFMGLVSPKKVNSSSYGNGFLMNGKLAQI